MKLIGLDVGTKRIGVAKADSTVCIAVPYSAIEVDGTEFEKIASLARAWDINSFVIGLPRNNEGEETEQSQYSRNFAEKLKKMIPDAKICFQDESLTSVEAEKRLKKRKKSYKKGDIDSEAATIILQDFLEEHTGKKPPAKTVKAAAAKQKSVKARKPHHFLTAIIIIAVLLAAAAGGAYGYYMYNLQPVVTDVDCAAEGSDQQSACQPVKFNIPEGASVGDVAMNLKNANLIRDALSFQVFYRLNYNNENIRVGEYELDQSMTPDQILRSLIRGGTNDNTFSFTVLPGETVQKIKDKLIELGYSAEEVETAFAADYSGKEYSWIFEGRPEGASLEGYLLGDTYEFYKTDEVETIIEDMLKEMAAVLEEKNVKAGFEVQGLNLYQGITLASIVQREANNAEDQAKVAQIFYNRLGAEIPLGSDVTVIYAWDQANPGRDPSEVSNAEKLEIDSPYNTRKNPGLPFGPISNPGVEALLAAATPDQSMAEYFYFLTGDDGLMYYGITEEDHQNNMQHCPELCNVAL